MRYLSNSPLINILAFQLGWFSCVMGAAHHMPWLGVGVTIPLLVWHLSQAQDVHSELSLVLIAAVFGSLFDQSLLSLGFIQFPAADWPVFLLPAWMLCLWVLFATTLNVGLRWMRGRYLVGAIFGLLGGPLAYISGVKLGAMQFLQPTAIVIALGIGWGLFMPALLWLSARLDGYTHIKTAGKDVQHV